VRYVKKKEAWGLLGARRQNLSRLRVEKLGYVGSRQVIPAACHRLDLRRARSSVPGMSAGHRVPLAYLRVAPPGQSPAYTYLKQHWQPLQIFNRKFWPCKKPSLAGKNFSFAET
jgi:hypothetical protein